MQDSEICKEIPRISLENSWMLPTSLYLQLHLLSHTPLSQRKTLGQTFQNTLNKFKGRISELTSIYNHWELETLVISIPLIDLQNTTALEILYAFLNIFREYHQQFIITSPLTQNKQNPTYRMPT